MTMTMIVMKLHGMLYMCLFATKTDDIQRDRQTDNTKIQAGKDNWYTNYRAL